MIFVGGAVGIGKVGRVFSVWEGFCSVGDREGGKGFFNKC